MVDVIGHRTLRDLLLERVERRADHPFLVHEDAEGVTSSLTYQAFLDSVDRTAAAWQQLGVKRGDAVTVQLPNCPEFLITWFALASLGAVMVPSNTANTTAELEHVVDHSESVTIVTSTTYLDRVEPLLASRPALRLVVARQADGELPDRALRLTDLVAAADPGDLVVPAVRPEDVAEMLFTSGTTARPKAVELTHANCLRSGERMMKSLLLDESDRCLTALPAFHSNAQSVTILPSLTVGGTCILLEQYRASRYWDQLRAHDATQTSLVAMQVRTLLKQPHAPTDTNHRVRRIFFAINVTDEEKDAFERRFAVELINGYGLSEALTIVSVAPVFGPKRWPSIGLPTYDREVRVVDDAGNEVPQGEVGEIIVHGVPGRTLMKGYFKDPEATARTLRGDWLYTGDYGSVDEYGYLYFLDRRKDVIKRAGENVSAAEVELTLLDHPDVDEAAVIAVPDPIRDEAVKAYVVTRPGAAVTADDIRAHCEARLASFKVPTIIEFRDALPKTSVGKIEKKLLRAELTGGA